METNPWQVLQSDFRRLQRECAIDPPLKPFGRLKAIWDVWMGWRFEYPGGEDGYGVQDRFKWYAQKGAAMLGFAGSGQDGVSFWLDQILRNVPNAYIGLNHESMKEIFDICGLAADYCAKCEADDRSGMGVPPATR